MTRILYTVGPPRSGKSNFANWAVNHLNLPNWHFKPVVVDEDMIRLAITGQMFVQESEEFVRATKHIMIKALLNQGYNVIVADTHSRRESIEPLLKIDPGAIAAYLDYNLEDCINRASNEPLKNAVRRIDWQLRKHPHQNLHHFYVTQPTPGDFECSVLYPR